jgi:hypothetical protein
LRQLLFICVILPNFCFAGIDARMSYIKAVEEFSTCGNALMPWGGNGWRPDEVEKPYVLQAKINRAKMQTEIDAGFYTEANLQELFVALTNNFYEKTADVKEILRKLPAEDHYIIWNNLFEIEKDARLIRNKLASDFRLHEEIIKMCANGLKDPTN